MKVGPARNQRQNRNPNQTVQSKCQTYRAAASPSSISEPPKRMKQRNAVTITMDSKSFSGVRVWVLICVRVCVQWQMGLGIE